MINRQKPQLFTIAILFALSFLIFSISGNAQNKPMSPPIPVELFFGHDQLNFQMIVKKKFAPDSKFDLLAISVFSENWDKNYKMGNSVVIPFQINYNIGKKGFAIAAGGEGNSAVGFSPLVGMEHSYAKRKVLAITVLNYLLNESQDLKLFGLYEYKPPINDTWSWYSRVQFVYNHSFAENGHNRSFLYLRAGVKKGPLGFGIGANWDQYGPNRITKDNFGVFTRWEF